jgi:hypothetical protein
VTTIAANRRSMAGDTLIDCDGTVCHTDKVFRIRDSLVGVAGNNNYTTKFLAWFRQECPPTMDLMEPDDEKGGFIALELNFDGLFLYTDLCEPDKLHDKAFAIGLGAQGACIAMEKGDTPAQAVRTVMRHSKATGGKVKEYFLLTGKRRRRTKYQQSTPVEKGSDRGTSEVKQEASAGSGGRGSGARNHQRSSKSVEGSGRNDPVSSESGNAIQDKINSGA